MSGAKLRFVLECPNPPEVELIITGNPKSTEEAKESINQILIQSRNSNLPGSDLSDDEFELWCTIRDPTLRSKILESKKKMENENLDKKECQNPDSGKKSNGSGDEVAENSMKSGARASAER